MRILFQKNYIMFSLVLPVQYKFSTTKQLRSVTNLPKEIQNDLKLLLQIIIFPKN